MFVISLFFYPTHAIGQIFQPEGLNMPGTWNSWTNPPVNNLYLASSTQVTGGKITKITSGTVRWQTIFNAAASGGNVVGGNHTWLFTSGANTTPWANKWAGVNVSMNSLQTYSYNSGADNTITLTNGKWYTMNWQDQGYAGTQAIFMETSAQPVDILSVVQSPISVESNTLVRIDITLSASPSVEEKFYLRYTSNNWAASSVAPFIITGLSGTASIPAFEAGTTVSYYIFSSTSSNPTTNHDMLSIKLNTNAGSNYNYTVVTPFCGLPIVSTTPIFPIENTPINITFNANVGNGALKNYSGNVYIHTAVITNLSSSDSDWRYTKTAWGANTAATLLNRIGTNVYSLTMADIRAYYGVPAGETIRKMVMVFRSDGTTPLAPSYLTHKNSDGSDITIDVYENSLKVKLLQPTGKVNIINQGETLNACLAAINHSQLALYVNTTLISQTSAAQLSQVVPLGAFGTGMHWVIASATNGSMQVRDSVAIYIRGAVNVAPLPNGTKAGINYIDPQTVTLVLHDPPGQKSYAFAIGDFNNWNATNNGYMNRTPDGTHFWITLSGLSAGAEYAYQYLIDGTLRLADPYTEKVIDPWNDRYIASSTYPNLKPYPIGKTTGIVSTFQTVRSAYQWEVPNFTRPLVQDLVIYELHIRDFVESGAIKDVTKKLDYLQTLGVNAIELMPINEFEGNDSWGYNPSFYFATDKAYGTVDDYKRFIDECHKRGMAVILDMVMNHSFSQSPFVQMYFDSQAGAYGQVTSSNPWYNVNSPNPDWAWGFDFNHESIHTKNLLDRINAYWLTEFNVDGFRFDFTKGFTNTPGNGWAYDAARIGLLKRMTNQIWAAKPGAYVILEHLTDNSEEVELANYGMLLWGNMNHQYSQSSMGYSTESDLSWGTHTARGYLFHNLISYMESHDEERIMYKNLQFGNNTNPAYNVRNLQTALKQSEIAAAFYILTPGPKMIWQFGELGYDFGINHCPNGTYNADCRTSKKPVPWSSNLNYFQVPERKALYDRYAELIRMKTNFPVFRTGNFNYHLDGLLKRMHLSSTSLNITLVGNFGVTAQNITPYFQHTGTWYEHFSGEVLNVSSTTTPIFLQPGEYRLYSNSKLYNNYFLKASGSLHNPASWGSNTDGSGISPVQFSTANTNYTILNQNNLELQSDWTVTGSNSRIIVGNGLTEVNFQLNAKLSTDYIIIKNNAAFTIKPNAGLTVNSRLVNEAGAGKLRILSEISGTGSLIHKNTGINASIQRYVPGGGYHFVSVPLASENNLTAGLFMNSYLFNFNAVSQLWAGLGSNPNTNLSAHQGYMIWYTGTNKTYEFTGALHNGDFLAATPSASAAGLYNLVPNPYPSAIDWQAADGWTKNNLNAAIYVWNRSNANAGNPNGQYASFVDGVGNLGGSRYIPVGQSFFVETSGTGVPLLRMNNNVRLHSNQAFFKNTQNDAVLTIIASTNAGNDETIIRLKNEATENFDSRFDAGKLFGSPALPQLYSISSDNRKLSINTISHPSASTIVPLSVQWQSTGEVRLTFNGIENYPSQIALLLEDLSNQQFTNLHEQNHYIFQYLNAGSNRQFNLHLLGLTQVSEITGKEIRIWNDQKAIYILHLTQQPIKASVELFDLQGKKILHQHYFQPLLSIPADRIKNAVIVRVTTGEGTITKKIIIH